MNEAYLKKRVKELDKQVFEQRKILKSHAEAINHHAEVMNKLIAQNKDLNQRLANTEVRKSPLILT